MRTVAIAIIMSALSAQMAAQWLDHQTPGIPRTADGQPNLTAPTPRTSEGNPDLSGLWARTSRTVVADLKPVQPWVNALVQQRSEDLGKDNMTVLCLPLGPMYITTRGADRNAGGMSKVVQTRGLIIILNGDLTYRQIFMDGRALESDPNPSWMGYSVGRWEGDTLVVESHGFNDRTWLDGGHPHTDGMRITERYRRPDFGHLELDVTLHEPALYATPWRATIRAQLTPDTELLEYVCNENTRSREHMVGKASDARQSEVTLAADILAKYTGTYVEQRPFWLDADVARVFEITFAEGALFLEQRDRGKVRLVPQSATLFDNRGLGLEFVKDGTGVVTHLFDKHVSGDYRFERMK
jgi:hypothetical protein